MMKAKNYKVQQLVEDPVQLMFLILGVFTMAMILPFTLAAINFVSHCIKNQPVDYKFPLFEDLKTTGYASVLFMAAEYLVRQNLFVLFLPVCREQHNKFEQELRCKKAAAYLFKTAYALSLTAYIYYHLRNQDFFPRLLGGKGAFINTLQSYPYQKHPEFLSVIVRTQAGYHLSGLIRHFVDVRKKDFIEMGLHHGLSVFLFTGAYLMNLFECVIVVSYCHDICDIFANVTKLLAETRFEKATACTFVSLMVLWVYTRIFVFGQFIWEINECDIDFKSPIMLNFFVFLMLFLMALHIHFFILFVQLLLNYINLGATEDQLEKLELEDDEDISSSSDEVLIDAPAYRNHRKCVNEPN
jgi:hypothetical protein